MTAPPGARARAAPSPRPPAPGGRAPLRPRGAPPSHRAPLTGFGILMAAGAPATPDTNVHAPPASPLPSAPCGGGGGGGRSRSRPRRQHSPRVRRRPPGGGLSTAGGARVTHRRRPLPAAPPKRHRPRPTAGHPRRLRFDVPGVQGAPRPGASGSPRAVRDGRATGAGAAPPRPPGTAGPVRGLLRSPTPRETPARPGSARLGPPRHSCTCRGRAGVGASQAGGWHGGSVRHSGDALGVACNNCCVSCSARSENMIT